jgi:hypothetical protein
LSDVKSIRKKKKNDNATNKIASVRMIIFEFLPNIITLTTPRFYFSFH